ncbi:MAG: hypothetical protein ACLP8S_21140 [Solirubrobacteraceae bacterium]
MRSAYRCWAAASKPNEPFAFHCYECALIREERAAGVYARCFPVASGYP